MTSLGLVTQGYFAAGGVQTVARWLKGVAQQHEFEVTVYDLATARNDIYSRRIAAPRSWTHRPDLLASSAEDGVFHVGAEIVEIEPARYMPRAHLTEALNSHDVLQVVAGAGTLAAVTARAGRPVALQPATMLRWERRAKKQSGGKSLGARTWSEAMTRATLPIERYALTHADAVLVHNFAMTDELRKLGVEPVLAPTGVDTREFRPAEEGYSASGPIVCVGRLNEPRKALDVLVDAYTHLRSLGDTRRLVLAGRGVLPPSLQRRICEPDLRQVVDVQADLPHGALVRLLQTASVFAQSSREEGLGIAVQEAMACGVPVVATRTAGTEMTVLPGVTGELCPQDDPVGLATAIKALTPQRAVLMSREARKVAEERFSTEAAALPFLKVWGQLADR